MGGFTGFLPMTLLLRRFLSGLVMMGCGLVGGLPAVVRAEIAAPAVIEGGIDLGGGRVLAWTTAGGERNERALWVLFPGAEPKSAGRLFAAQVRGAVGAGRIVYVLDGALKVAPQESPGAVESLNLPGEWSDVAWGAMGFVAGGGDNALAVSRDGRTWAAAAHKSADGGIFERFAPGDGKLAALRQTSKTDEGWNLNVTEVLLSDDGRAWRVVATIAGGDAYSPLASLTWVGDRWVAVGSGRLVSILPTGVVEEISPEGPDGSVLMVIGEEPLARRGAKWILGYDHQVWESSDLKRWTPRGEWRGDQFQGSWLNDGNGTAMLVGRTRADWARLALVPFDRVTARDGLEGVGSKAGAATPSGPLAAGRGPVLPMAGPETAYAWPELVVEAVRRSAGKSLVSAAFTPPRRQPARLALGRRWVAADVIAALERREPVADIFRAMSLDCDGSEIDMPGAMAVLTHPAWKAAEARAEEVGGDFRMAVEFWGMVYQRSAFADELARLVIARRQRDVPPAVKPVDDAALRQRYAAGDPGAAYALYLLHYAATAQREGWTRPADLPPAAEVVARATAGDYAPAQWIRVQQGQVKEPLEVARLLRRSAEAGDAHGAFYFAMLYAEPGGEPAFAPNPREAEYWLIEAAVRGWPEQMDVPYVRPWLELANLYSARGLNDVLASMLPTYQDSTARWLRELESRGGALADYARKVAAYHDDETRRGANQFAYAQRLARLAPERPLFTAEERAQLEAGVARNDPVAWLAVAEACAKGRGVRQDDLRAAASYRAAAEAGAGLPAYRALVAIYLKGIGVKKEAKELQAWLTKAADTGDVESLRQLADWQHYVDSEKHGIAQNYAAAWALYERLAGRGDARALQSLAMMQLYGRGVPADREKARGLLERAAALGHAPAMVALGGWGLGGDIPWAKRDWRGAVAWYRRALAAGDRGIRYALAEALEVTEEKAEARRLYLELAQEDRGNFLARYKLASLADTGDEAGRAEAAKWHREVWANRAAYDFMKENSGRFVREYDEEEAAKPGSLPYYRKRAKLGGPDEAFDFAMRLFAANRREDAPTWIWSAANSGHPAATAVHYAELAKKDQKGASEWVRAAADRGNSQAMLIVGLEKSATDKAAGLALVEKAADAGNADAKFRLGLMQFQGREVPQDQAKGLQRLTEAAEAKFPLAQATLGQALLTGQAGVAADPTRGLAYLRSAAEQTHYAPVAAQAALALGQAYERGVGTVVTPNRAEAVKFYRLALQRGGPNPQLQNHLTQLERQLSIDLKMGK